MELGMHFALSDDLAARLLAARGDDALIDEIVEDIEENSLSEFFCETDKAWDPIHCALAPDTSERSEQTWPAHGVILGDEDINTDIDDQLVTYLTPARAAEVAVFLDATSQTSFEKAYDAMPEDDRNPEFGEEERAYAWSYLQEVSEFFQRAASERRHVLFTVRF